MIETTDWDALDEEMTNTTYEVVGKIPPDISAKIKAAADNTLRRMELEKLRDEANSFQDEIDGLQSKANSLRTRIDDLVLAK
jgi:FtsZ-binding cell division protein ZapB